MRNDASSGRESRYRGLLGAVVLGLIAGLAAPAARGQASRDDEVAAVRSWVEAPPGTVEGISFVEKAVYRMGDRIALDIVRGFSDDEILDPSRLERVLGIVTLSFSQPRLITRERDRSPLETDRLLWYLERRVRDETPLEAIRATEEYVTLATDNDALMDEVAATVWNVQTGKTTMDRTMAAERLFELTRFGRAERMDDGTIATFASLLDGACDPVRYWVARSIGNFGPRARIASLKLEKVLVQVDCLDGSMTSATGIRFALGQMGITVPDADCETGDGR